MGNHIASLERTRQAAVGMKRCPKCEEVLPFAKFHKSNREKFGITVYCKVCNDERDKQYKERNPANYRAIRRRASRKHQLSKFYNITPEQYAAMAIQQDQRCAGCYESETALGRGGDVKPLAVDHDHTTGEFRGLLCNACNSTLGYAKDDVARLEGLIAYLRKHQRG